MCMNCGCGEPEKRHHPTDITSDDLQKAADGANKSIEETSSNMQASLGTMARRKNMEPTPSSTRPA